MLKNQVYSLTLLRIVQRNIAGTGGDIFPHQKQEVIAGTSFTFQEKAALGYEVNYWLLDHSVVQEGGENYTLARKL